MTLRSRLVVGLISLAFLVSTVRVVMAHVRGADLGGRTTIRIAHWQLEGGVREAFDAVALAYERMHPGVDIVQVPVPGKVYATWRKTRQVGGDVPDLIQMGFTDDQTLAAEFIPLTRWVEEPNPYQEGTPLAGRPWRESFLDGLAGASGMATMQEPYSVAYSAHTVRLYVNRELYLTINGSDRAPRNLKEFLAVCRQAETWAQAQGRSLSPIAGSRFTAHVLHEQFFATQTQILDRDLDDLGTLRSAGDLRNAWLDGRVDFNHAAIRQGYALVRELASHMAVGFMGHERDEAIFRFVTGEALFIPTGSWDYGSIVDQAPFPVGVFPLPLPTSGEGQFGDHVLGRRAESADRVAGNIHLASTCKHPEVAIDFLRFLTSQEGNGLFVSVSRWMPAIVGVEPHPDTRAFMPVQEGYPFGLLPAPLMYGSGEVYRIQSTHIHRLFAPSATALDDFLAAMNADAAAAMRRDLAKAIEGGIGSARKLDPALMALHHLGRPGDRERASGLWQTQNLREWDVHRNLVRREQHTTKVRR